VSPNPILQWMYRDKADRDFQIDSAYKTYHLEITNVPPYPRLLGDRREALLPLLSKRPFHFGTYMHHSSQFCHGNIMLTISCQNPCYSTIWLAMLDWRNGRIEELSNIEDGNLYYQNNTFNCFYTTVAQCNRMGDGSAGDGLIPEMRKRSLAELKDESLLVGAQQKLPDHRMGGRGAGSIDSKKGEKASSGNAPREIAKHLCPYCLEQNELYYKFCWHCGRRIIS